MLATRDPSEEAERLQQLPGNWITAGIETRMFWPKHLQTLSHDGRLFLLQPVLRDEHGESLPAIALRTDTYGFSDNQARAAIMRLASALAWREGQKLEIVMWGGGNRPYRMGIVRSHGITEILSDENLCSPQDDAAHKALAYYREGLSLDNPFYAFLGFHKAFCRSIPDGKTRGPWILAVLPTLDDRAAIERRNALLQTQADIPTYLSRQCRNAIAHAERDDIIDPDDPTDHQRIHDDLPLIRHLAELAMEQHLGIGRPQSYEREHLYELQGFRALFDEEQLTFLKRGEVHPDRPYEIPDHYVVVARKGRTVVSLGVMSLVGAGLHPGGIVVELAQAEGRVGLLLQLDFVNERLVIDPLGGLGLISGNRNTRAEIESEIEFENFRWCVFGNGSVEIWNSEGLTRLGKSQSYIPLNMVTDLDGHLRYLAELKALLDQLPEP